MILKEFANKFQVNFPRNMALIKETWKKNAVYIKYLNMSFKLNNMGYIALT